jgi:hypothetical protein
MATKKNEYIEDLFATRTKLVGERRKLAKLLRPTAEKEHARFNTLQLAIEAIDDAMDDERKIAASNAPPQDIGMPVDTSEFKARPR